MLGYKSSLPYSQPSSPVAGLASPRPMSGAHEDVYRGLMTGYNANQQLAQEAANADYDAKYREAQRSLLLGGLRQMSEGQESERGLGQARLGMMNTLLSGLFK